MITEWLDELYSLAIIWRWCRKDYLVASCGLCRTSWICRSKIILLRYWMLALEYNANSFTPVSLFNSISFLSLPLMIVQPHWSSLCSLNRPSTSEPLGDFVGALFGGKHLFLNLWVTPHSSLIWSSPLTPRCLGRPFPVPQTLLCLNHTSLWFSSKHISREKRPFMIPPLHCQRFPLHDTCGHSQCMWMMNKWSSSYSRS